MQKKVGTNTDERKQTNLQAACQTRNDKATNTGKESGGLVNRRQGEIWKVEECECDDSNNHTNLHEAKEVRKRQKQKQLRGLGYSTPKHHKTPLCTPTPGLNRPSEAPFPVLISQKKSCKPPFFLSGRPPIIQALLWLIVFLRQTPLVCHRLIAEIPGRLYKC